MLVIEQQISSFPRPLGSRIAPALGCHIAVELGATESSHGCHLPILDPRSSTAPICYRRAPQSLRAPSTNPVPLHRTSFDALSSTPGHRLCRLRKMSRPLCNARASATCCSVTVSLPARSAIVLATRRTRCSPRADSVPARSCWSNRRLVTSVNGATRSRSATGKAAFTTTPRLCAARRAMATRPATTDEDSPVDAANNFAGSHRLSTTARSNRSSNGPERRRA